MDQCVLVSSCNRSGGLHLLSVDSGGGLRVVSQLCEGSVRGFAYDNYPNGEKFYLARGQGILTLSPERLTLGSCGQGWFDVDPEVDNYMFHDLLVSGGMLYVVMTRFNRIAIIDCATQKRVGTLDIDGARCDRSHLNSLHARPDGLLLSMFSWNGKKNLHPWREEDGAIVKIPWGVVERFSKSGKRVDLKKNIPPPLVDGLEQPHSFAVHRGWLYFCESFWHRVWRVPVDGGDSELVREFDGGYMRGLQVVGDFLLVGESCLKNHKTIPSHFEEISDHARVHVLDLRSGALVHTVDIPSSAEVYHIAECPDAFVGELPAGGSL